MYQYCKEKALLGRCELEVYFEMFGFFHSRVLRRIFNNKCHWEVNCLVRFHNGISFIYLFRLVIEKNEEGEKTTLILRIYFIK